MYGAFYAWELALLWGGISVNTSFLETLSIQGISIPIAVLIWIMIYPMMLKVDFKSINEVVCAPKGFVVNWIVILLIKPFTMYAI